jgi:hypothetical protein
MKRLSRFDRRIIYTYENGTPIEGRPDGDPPGENADIEDKIAWMRAWSAYHNRVADVSDRAFAEQFRKTIRGTP